MTTAARLAFAGDRAVAVEVLGYLVRSGVRPLALLLPAPGRATHDRALLELCPSLPPDRVLRGQAFRRAAGVELLRSLQLDFLVSVHFPYLVPPEVLELAGRGCLNLHPAYLPYNRGWHTASWALVEGTPLGATLHHMDAGIDTGPIIHRRELKVGPGDTAADLYPRLSALEVEVFMEAWPGVAAGSTHAMPQEQGSGTTHLKEELLRREVQRLDPDEHVRVGDLLRRLRALTTNRVEEAAWFEAGGDRYRVQVRITREEAEP